MKSTQITLKGAANFQRECDNCGFRWVACVPVEASHDSMMERVAMEE